MYVCMYGTTSEGQISAVPTEDRSDKWVFESNRSTFRSWSIVPRSIAQVDVPQPFDQPFEQMVHSVRDVHVPHPVAQPMMPQMPMSTPYMGGNVFGTQALGTTGFGTFGMGGGYGF